MQRADTIERYARIESRAMEQNGVRLDANAKRVAAQDATKAAGSFAARVANDRIEEELGRPGTNEEKIQYFFRPKMPQVNQYSMLHLKSRYQREFGRD